jgi:lipopolysaccharide transport system permease protein
MTVYGFRGSDAKLAFNLLKMTVRDRYLGSSLGSFWSVANPLLMLGIFTFVFGFVLKIRLPGNDTALGYVIWLVSGYGPWIAINEALMACTVCVVGASGIVKNIAFKTELLPISAAFIGLISLVVSLIFLVLLLIGDGKLPSWRLLWTPLIIAVQFLLVIALGTWLAMINVFYRDLTMILPNVLTVLMYATPIFYPIESTPRAMQLLSQVNPFYLVVDSYRRVFIQNADPEVFKLAYVVLLSLLIFHFGLKAFRKAKGHFDAAL